MKLTEAYIRGQKLKDYTITVLHPEPPQKPSKQAWADFHADCLAILLAGIPQQEDNKLRMDHLQTIADELTQLHFKSLT